MSINSWAGSSFLKSILNTCTPRLVWESQFADFFLQLLYQLVSGNVSLKVENKRFSIKCIFLDFFFLSLSLVCCCLIFYAKHFLSCWGDLQL